MPLLQPQTLPANPYEASRAYALSETRRKEGINTGNAWLF
jgi:hypothetical protein